VNTVPSEEGTSICEVRRTDRAMAVGAVAQCRLRRELGIAQRVGDEPDRGGGFVYPMVAPFGSAGTQRLFQIRFETAGKCAQAHLIEKQVRMPQQRPADAVLVGVHERIHAVDPAGGVCVRLRLRRAKPKPAPRADRIADRAVGIVGLLEEALVAAQERLGEHVRPHGIEREELALDLVEPGLELTAEAGRRAPPKKTPGAFPALQPLAKLRGEPCRIGRERMSREALLDLGVRGRELREQRGEFFLRLAAQCFEAFVQRRGGRNLLLSHVALDFAEQGASVEGPQRLLSLEACDPAQRCLPAADRLDRSSTVRTDNHAGLHPSAANVVGIEVQLAVRELESGQKIRDPKLVAFDVLCAGKTPRSRVGEGEHPDHEQESQRAPFDDVGPILFGAVSVVERKRQAQRELPLVRAGHHRLLQNPDRYDDTGPKQHLACAAVFAHRLPWGMTGF
jgi:hypothetical protein